MRPRPNPLRALICGAGAAGHLHAAAYRALGVDVVAVYDPDPTRARWLAQMHKAEIAASPAALFATDAECASLTSPPPAHVEQASLAARKGRVVFVEKPIATSIEGIERLASLPGWVVPVVQWRAGRALRAVRAAIASGALGPTPIASVDLAWARDEAYFAAGRATRDSWGGGVLLSVGVHAVDAVIWALGQDVASARGVLRRRPGIEGLEVETTALAELELQGGAIAVLRATFDAGGGTSRLAFTGGGVSAVIEGGEMDPTGGRVAWSAGDPHVLASLRAIEERCDGAVEPPLHLAFMRAAIASAFDPGGPRGHDALPTARDVREAHRAIFEIYTAAAMEDPPTCYASAAE